MRYKKNKWDKFSKKYRHVGYSHLGVPEPWKPIVSKAVIEIEKIMWPQWWLPMFAKHLIHYLATDNSVVRVKYWWAYNLRLKLAKGQISDIKDKYATLRIYGSFSDEQYKIIDQAEKECDETCEWCGSKEDVKTIDYGWIYNLCIECRIKEEDKKLLVWYKQGAKDELHGTSSTLPNPEFETGHLVEKAYNLGVHHAIIGDIRCVDYLFDDEILKIIRN